MGSNEEEFFEEDLFLKGDDDSKYRRYIINI